MAVRGGELPPFWISENSQHMSDMAIDAGVRAERSHRLLKARLMVRSHEYDIVIRNLSSHGLGGSTITPVLAVDDTVTVLLPDGHAVQGVVRWVAGRSFGLSLLRKIDAEQQRIERPGELASTWEVQKLHQVITPRRDLSKVRRVI